MCVLEKEREIFLVVERSWIYFKSTLFILPPGAKWVEDSTGRVDFHILHIFLPFIARGNAGIRSARVARHLCDKRAALLES